MKKIKNFLLFLFLISYPFLCFISCTFDNEEDLLEEFYCDTIDVVYNDLTYIFSDICTACHSEVFSYIDEIKMDSYDNVKSSINTGLVWPAINHLDGVSPMPDNLPKLQECDLNKIGVWINAGMPNI